MSEETRFIITRHDAIGEEWPDGRQYIETLIVGDLADKVRAHYKREGDVVIKQWGVEGGYSEYTVEWDWEATLHVGDFEVWGDGSYEYSAFDPRDMITPTALARHLLDIAKGAA